MRVADGDKVAFEEIVGRYSRQLLEFAIGRVKVFQDAEDIVQETFLRAYSNIDRFDCQYSLKSWLFTIAYRVMVSSFRKKRPELLSNKVAQEIIEEQERAEADYQWLWDEIEQIGADAYTALWLKYRQELAVEEIASIMGKSKVGVRVLLHRARNRLMKKISAQPQKYAITHLWRKRESVCRERT